MDTSNDNQMESVAEEVVVVSEEVTTKAPVKKKSKKTKEFKKVSTPKTEEELKKSKHKKCIIITAIVILLLAIIGGVVWLVFFSNIFKNEETVVEDEEIVVEGPKFYGKLSGLQIKDESENSKPTYCIQIPNGIDGARPQAGLNQAAVVFEAIAEAGITRFAAIYQNPKDEAIGPIRSLRNYYLDWDTPFDCTVVHAGGATDAIAALRAGGYREVDESLIYTWRNVSSYWAPNNLFTSAELLEKAARDDGYSSSNPQVLPRLTPEEAADAVATARKNAGLDQTEENAEENAEENVTPLVKEIAVNFGGVGSFNTVYHYDEATNSYNRSYASGEDHIVYTCIDTGKAQPDPKTDCGVAKQVSPSAIAVMKVDEYLDTDNYHHVIQTIGTGNAYIFQNGTATRGTWKKNSKSAQIEFRDDSGNTISFTPGQLWIAAIPNSGGSVRY